MNKKFYFALALTAGLFASCSSDDLTSQAPAGPNVNDNDAAVINIAVANPGVTRGTGTVGGTDALTNVWAGQTFNLFMFEKGTFNPAQKTVDDGAGGTMDVDIYNNAEMITPTGGATAATYVIGTEEQFNYYPTTGAYSFWAYRVDDAGQGTGGVGVPVGVGDATATEVKIPFTIDGSQDILTAVPDEEGDLAALQAGYPSATEDQIYSAYSSRRNITPELTFKHQLTRLTFKVKANSSEVSDAADIISTTDPNVYRGFKVTSISVKSKANGNIIAAWKDNSTYNAQAVVFDDANEVWTNLASLTPMALKSRGQGVTDKQMGDWSVALTVDIAADGTATYGTPYTLHGSNFATASTTAVYTTNTEDSYTGVPNGTLTTLGDLVADYITNHKISTDPDPLEVTPGSISGYAYFKTQDLLLDGTPNAAAKLVDLVPVTPKWTVESEDFSATYADEAALDAAVTAGTAVKISATTYADLAAATIAENVGYFYWDGAKVWKIKAAATNTEDPVSVGEALLVAPMAQSYEMTVTYKRWKKTSTNNYSEIEGTVTKSIARNTASALFEAGKSYNVVITLYKDGDAATDTNLEQWQSGDTDIEIEGEE